jgi:hypothetical protein
MEKTLLITQIITTIVLVITLFITIKEFRNSNKSRKQEVYTKLELSSIEIFRMAIENPKLEKIYSGELEKNLPETEFKKYMEYSSCLLNLFEIHFNLRSTKDIDPVVFATWIPWLYDLCVSAYFRKAWEDLQKHYVPRFRRFINILIQTIDDSDDPLKERAFYDKAAQLMGDDEIIKNWINRMK